MPAIDFPNSPTVGQTYTANDSVWIWTGVTWDAVTSNVTASDTAPIAPKANDIWFNSAEGRSYIYYDSFWVEMSPGIKGDPGSATIYYWKETAIGGEILLSGYDDNNVTLAYTVGQEQLYINGVLQVRNADYVASTGSTVVLMAPLVAGDIVTLWAPNAFNVANTYTTTLTDGLFQSAVVADIMDAY